ncbi:MAG: DUF1727 domain-containing protein [Propionibacteriaceae bacterium]|jgi:UDP-N-acetylmuramyl tripeptide synthase|nr:DUF1727 domain-containing protein [Propionibacteriaceae bacterium]
MRSVRLTVWFGKAIARLTRLAGGHASALPGLAAERLDPDFLPKIMRQLPLGVAVVSGTNGKTTTTKIVVELLRAAGLKVFTNPSGSNFTRGVISAAIEQMKKGRLDCDIAVLELDEAHAVRFVDKVAPTAALLLNVLRDQLDRFGEIDTTARYLGAIAARTVGPVVLNREDPLVASLPTRQPVYFGYSDKVAALFPSDAELYGRPALAAAAVPTDRPVAAVVLEDLGPGWAAFNLGTARLSLPGAHNAFNAAAALALAGQLLPGRFEADQALRALAAVEPAFGRGELFTVDGALTELLLVKNPSGFRVVLGSQASREAAVMIAVNDAYADGRDMSWLWDVDFSVLPAVAQVSGVRAYDMALRLDCQQIPVEAVEPDLGAALRDFLAKTPGQPKQIYASYTAMLAIRRLLKQAAEGTP